MATDKARAALSRLPLFSALGPEVLADLLASCRRHTLAAGAQIIEPGQPADRFFVILAGKIKVYKLSSKGDEQILHLYGAGQTFGEAAMWTGDSFPAHAEALSESVLLEVRRATLKDAIVHNPELALSMLSGMSAKLREFNRLIEQLSLREVPARLAGVLLELRREAASDSFRLEQSKRELAAQIGTIAETLSRAFRKLKESGLIEVRGSRITILDEDGLADLAES